MATTTASWPGKTPRISGSGLPADLVIGQQDFFHTNAQGPGIGLQTGLYGPTGLAVYKGDLYVADTNNNRILRYPQALRQRGKRVSRISTSASRA